MSYESFIKSQLFNRKSSNLSKLGFDFSNTNTQEEYLKLQSLLYTEYHILCESMPVIMTKFGIPSSKTMDTLFREFNIEARSMSDQLKNAYLQNRATPFGGKTFTHIWHKSWFGEIFYLRSTYELKYAESLDLEKVKYFVEHFRIKYFDASSKSYRIAIPDFYLPETNTIVEIKSTYWLNEEEMQSKKLAYQNLGYKFQLVLDGKVLLDW